MEREEVINLVNKKVIKMILFESTFKIYIY